MKLFLLHRQIKNLMEITVTSFAEYETVAKAIAHNLGADYKTGIIHRFPDRETQIRVENPEQTRKQVIITCSLYHPNSVVLPLLFLAETFREYGAEKILLIAPYLAYMRQDKQFRQGEGISARYFARLISNYFDGLVTVDPHLHRIKSLEEIYTIPSRIIHAAPLVADWISKNIHNPLLVGPDSESEQWVKDLSQRSGSPFVILEKTRHGDRNVDVSVPDVNKWLDHTPVLFDDIISTGRTMIETVGHLIRAGLPSPVCIGVHGVFSDNACEELVKAGAGKIITTNSIIHSSNAIDLVPAICEEIVNAF